MASFDWDSLDACEALSLRTDSGLGFASYDLVAVSVRAECCYIVEGNTYSGGTVDTVLRLPYDMTLAALHEHLSKHAFWGSARVTSVAMRFMDPNGDGTELDMTDEVASLTLLRDGSRELWARIAVVRSRGVELHIEDPSTRSTTLVSTHSSSSMGSVLGRFLSQCPAKFRAYYRLACYGQYVRSRGAVRDALPLEDRRVFHLQARFCLFGGGKRALSSSSFDDADAPMADESLGGELQEMLDDLFAEPPVVEETAAQQPSVGEACCYNSFGGPGVAPREL